ncbi:MAG: hypothetical protein ABWX88_10340 [Pseudoxanthomonas sp.]
MKMRLLTALFATAALGGCATYDYAGGSAPGGYYYGRPTTEYYGPYGAGYGYGAYGYGGYGGYGYGYSPYGYSYYGGYYPYYPYRPHHPRPGHDHDPDDDRPPSQGGRPPPWRRPDGRYQETGQVMIPPRHGNPQVPGQPQVRNDGGRYPGTRVRPAEGGNQPPRMSSPSQPRPIERVQPAERPQPSPRTESRERVRKLEP